MQHIFRMKFVPYILAAAILLAAFVNCACGVQYAFAAPDEPAIAQSDPSNAGTDAGLPDNVTPLNCMFAIIALGAVIGLRTLILKKKPEDVDLKKQA